MIEWIPCSERLPPSSQAVLIFYRGLIVYGALSFKKSYKTYYWVHFYEGGIPLHQSEVKYWAHANLPISREPLNMHGLERALSDDFIRTYKVKERRNDRLD